MELISKVVGQVLENDAATIARVPASNICFGRFGQGTTGSKARYFLTDVIPYDSKQGSALVDDYIVQVDVFGSDITEITYAAKAIREALDRITPGDYNGVDVSGSRFEGGSFDPDDPDEVDLSKWTLMFSFQINRNVRP